MVGKVVRSLVCGGGYTTSTRQRGVSIMGEFMSTIQYNKALPYKQTHIKIDIDLDLHVQ